MSTVTTDDPLAALVVNAHSVDRERLAGTLDSWARIDPHEGLIRFMPGAKEKGTIKQLILVALLGQMAIKLLNDQQEEGLTPSELSQCTAVKGSSLRPQLKVLADGDFVLKNESGKYVVPSHAFDRALVMLGDDDG
ncbi:MAG: hypothetical protein OXF01_08310 [Gemmatimonadetes bacterium]|nr:hypothetical protein [Gemmatimonadota bacterium]